MYASLWQGAAKVVEDLHTPISSCAAEGVLSSSFALLQITFALGWFSLSWMVARFCWQSSTEQSVPPAVSLKGNDIHSDPYISSSVSGQWLKTVSSDGPSVCPFQSLKNCDCLGLDG